MEIHYTAILGQRSSVTATIITSVGSWISFFSDILFFFLLYCLWIIGSQRAFVISLVFRYHRVLIVVNILVVSVCIRVFGIVDGVGTVENSVLHSMISDCGSFDEYLVPRHVRRVERALVAEFLGTNAQRIGGAVLVQGCTHLGRVRANSDASRRCRDRIRA